MILVKNYEKFLKTTKAKGPVSTPQIFFGKTENFHPQGLFSEELFGIDGSRERGHSFSWIELNAPIIHPSIYDILKKRIFMKINLLLSGELTFSIAPNGALVEDPEGEIDGLLAFYKNIDKIRFHEDEPPKQDKKKPKNIIIDGVGSFDLLKDSEDETEEDFIETDRNKIIKMLYNRIADKTFFMDKLIVISPTYRNITKDPTTEDWIVDDISKHYQKIIMASTQIKNVHGSLFNALSFRLQMLVRDLYDTAKSNLGQKGGFIRENMLGKRVDYSSRAVIAPGPEIDVGYVGLPFRLCCMLFEPFLVYGLLNSPYSKQIPKEFHIAVKEFLNKETFIT